jgi:predicted metal-binding protein
LHFDFGYSRTYHDVIAGMGKVQMNASDNTEKNILFQKLRLVYAEMEGAYNLAAQKIGLTCRQCRDNCCLSYFQHHTYVEWAYLWRGLRACDDKRLEGFLSRAQAYVTQAEAMLAQGARPHIMCPLNEDGLCGLYEHRLMICRMHGVPNSLVRPDGKKLNFPGCGPCQELYAERGEVPVLDRTPYYRTLAHLETAFRGTTTGPLPRVNLTLAEMLVKGPPPV